MSTVEIETGRYVKRFAFWNPATWSIPKLYWDAWSQEQRLHAICRQLDKVIKYADYLGVNVDDIAARLKAIEEGQLDPIIEAAVEAWFEEHADDITSRITALEDVLPISEFSAENTVKNSIDALNSSIEALSALLPDTAFGSENTVKDAIDDLAETVNTLDSTFANAKYKPQIINRADIINRFEYPYLENAVQSVCAFEQNGIKYIAYGFQNTVRIHLLSDHTTISVTENNSIGHCNQMCYKNEKIYATTLDNSLVAVLDVSNVYAPIVSVLDLQTYGFANVAAFDNYKDNFMVMEDDDIFELDITEGTKTYLSKLPILNYYPGIPQSVRYSSRLDNFYMVRGGVNYIVFFDYDRTIAGITQFREHYKLASVSELEDYIFFGDKIFFVSSAQTGYIDSISLSNAYETDFMNCSNVPDDFNSPTGGLINVKIDQTADGLNNNLAAFPGYGTSGIFVFKYPQDMVNLIKENGITTRTTVTLANDCPYVIPVAGIVRIDFAHYDCAGIWIDNGELVCQNINLTNPDKTMWTQEYNSLPVFINGNGGSIMCPSGPSPAWTDGYLIRAAYCEVYCVANAYNSSSLANCWGDKNLSFL